MTGSHSTTFVVSTTTGDSWQEMGKSRQNRSGGAGQDTSVPGSWKAAEDVSGSGFRAKAHLMTSTA